MKKFFLIFLALIFLIGAGIIYLNNVILPIKIKSLIIKSLQEQSKKRASLESLQFNIFKGLVLRNLIIYDDEKPIISIKESSAAFLILPIFKKMIVIPALKFKSVEIFLERRKDNTLNIQDLLLKKTPQSQKAKFSIYVYKVNITDAKIKFQDKSFPKAFSKNIENSELNLYLSLPGSIKFNLKSEILTTPIINLKASGNFLFPEKQLTAKITLKDFSPREFFCYYQNLGISIPEGSIDALIDLKLKNDILYLDFATENKNLTILRNMQVFANLNANLKSNLQYSLNDKQVNGYLDVINAVLKLGKMEFPFADINGRFEFSLRQLKWLGLSFKYSGVTYKTQGTLTDFRMPFVQLELTSKDLFLESNFALNNKLIKLSKLSGRYLSSEFLMTGDINTSSPPDIETDIDGKLNINLEDIKELLKKFTPLEVNNKGLQSPSAGLFLMAFKKQLEKIKPEGSMHVQFNVNGNINDIKSCKVLAEFASSSISAYGLKAKDFFLKFSQKDAIIDIPRIYLSFYDGSIEAGASMNLDSSDLPFRLTADMQGIKIEKLKLDTVAKEEDLAGTVSAHVKINGLFNEISKLSGAGKINIVEGKLWQLNLFKGLGLLLFAKDFSNIIFHESSCDFFIQDKYIFTNILELKSNITELSGSARIGFDSSIDASLNVHILDEAIPLTGTFKDVTTVILDQAGRFGVIKISGTLREPKYRFQPAFVDIIKGLREAIFGE